MAQTQRLPIHLSLATQCNFGVCMVCKWRSRTLPLTEVSQLILQLRGHRTSVRRRMIEAKAWITRVCFQKTWRITAMISRCVFLKSQRSAMSSEPREIAGEINTMRLWILCRQLRRVWLAIEDWPSNSRRKTVHWPRRSEPRASAIEPSSPQTKQWIRSSIVSKLNVWAMSLPDKISFLIIDSHGASTVATSLTII